MRTKQFTAAASAALLASALLFGCGTQSEPLTPAVPAAELAEITVTGKEADDAFRASQYAFALELFRRVQAAQNDGNTMVSPYSVIEALGMTANGARGDTLAEMQQVLGGGIAQNDLNNYLYTWRMNQPDTDTCKLNTANGIWMKDADFEVKQDFLLFNTSYFGAELRKAPFNGSTVNEINDWVSEHTDKMIPKIIDTLNPLDRMVLVNAVCFDAKWKNKYDPKRIKEGIFCDIHGFDSSVQMLYSDESEYLELDGAVGFLRDYDGPYAFVGILPPDDVTVQEWLTDLDATDLQKMIDSRTAEEVTAGIPEFTFDTDTTLQEILPEMGMPAAFTPEADFSGISDTELHIGEVIHKTHIELDADGTKAAAATAVTLQRNGDIAPDTKKAVILNRPFVFMILDKSNDLPVFIGTVQSL